MIKIIKSYLSVIGVFVICACSLFLLVYKEGGVGEITIIALFLIPALIVAILLTVIVMIIRLFTSKNTSPSSKELPTRYVSASIAKNILAGIGFLTVGFIVYLAMNMGGWLGIAIVTGSPRPCRLHESPGRCLGAVAAREDKFDICQTGDSEVDNECIRTFVENVSRDTSCEQIREKSKDEDSIENFDSCIVRFSNSPLLVSACEEAWNKEVTHSLIRLECSRFIDPRSHLKNSGLTFLMMAGIEYENVQDEFERAIRAGADINAKDLKGYTALHYNWAEPELLLSNGADPNIQGGENDMTPPFYWADQSNFNFDEDLLASLIKAKWIPKLTTKNGDTLLHILARRKFDPEAPEADLEAVNRLRKLGLHPMTKNRAGQTAVDESRKSGRQVLFPDFQ